ncbi:hypothetical protein PCL_01780 [Purpureocillium lilacinum]|uniref:Nudix hydrolase domain-containing protein n=1 Tax=Purpureocillium lilacinum TaxID=33203 RepID=A0A2U3E2F3_PURLI|nr:hypothetical protein PCL_01780 [Purpureocillium lilacinum]
MPSQDARPPFLQQQPSHEVSSDTPYSSTAGHGRLEFVEQDAVQARRRFSLPSHDTRRRRLRDRMQTWALLVFERSSGGRQAVDGRQGIMLRGGSGSRRAGARDDNGALRSPALPLATETQILALVSPAVSSWFRSFGGPWPDVVHLNARAAGRLHSETPGSARPKPTTTRLARPAGAVPTPFTTPARDSIPGASPASVSRAFCLSPLIRVAFPPAGRQRRDWSRKHQAAMGEPTTTDMATGFTVAEGLPASLSLSPGEFLAARPHIHRLMAACMVFRRGGGEDREQQCQHHQEQEEEQQQQQQQQEQQQQAPPLQTLLIRRAASDSYPLKWEIPGGSVSTARDASVLHAAARELREETGLRVARFHCPLGMVPAPLPANPPPATAAVAVAAASSSLGHEDEAGNGNGIGCEDGNGNGDDRLLQSPPGLGIAPEEEHARQEPHDEALTVTFWETGRRWGKVSLLVDVREDVARIPSRGRIADAAPASVTRTVAAGQTAAAVVAGDAEGPPSPTIVMDPREHEEWAWLTEEEVRRGVDARGRRMEYTSEGVWRGVLAGFAARRALLDEAGEQK